MTHKRWTEKEKQDFFDLLSKYPASEAIKIHAKNENRTYKGINLWYNKHKKEIPKLFSDFNYKKWSKDEIITMLQLVAEHPNNFSEAFRIHAKNTERTVASVRLFFNRYRKQENAKICMATIGKNKIFPNRKIVLNPKEEITPSKTIWKKILYLLHKL